jgi:hypothetical protein
MREMYYPLDVSEEIVCAIFERDWLVHNFNTNKSNEIYNPSNYLHSAFSGYNYTLVLDLNIYQFLLNSVKKEIPNKNYRDAVALLVFCQIANIQIDPTYAVYEKLNYNASNLDDALPDLELFHNINNSEMDKLAKYAIEFSDTINIKTSITIDYAQERDNLMKYRKLTEWDSLYLIMLSIVNIKYDDSIPANNKLPTFLDWTIRKFRKSLVATIYAMVLFGKKPIKKMMKFKTAQNTDERRRALWNMTWDLYIMNQFFRKWTGKTEKDEYIFASADNAFCQLLRSSIDVQKQESFDPLISNLTESEYKIAQRFLETDMNNVERVYLSESWKPEYRDSLIAQYENKLFGS